MTYRLLGRATQGPSRFPSARNVASRALREPVRLLRRTASFWAFRGSQSRAVVHVYQDGEVWLRRGSRQEVRRG